MDKYTKQINLGRVFLTAFLFLNFYSNAQSLGLNYYLPDSIEYDKNISTPSEILGHEIGEFHVTHDKLVYYLNLLAQQSNRISIQKYGHTFEKRPLLLLTISSPENLAKLEHIKEQHHKLSEGATFSSEEISNMPVVVWLGYSVHGNESSGSNAALLVAYYLAAAKRKEIDELLASTIILIDPSTNPDGLQRFSTWANSNKSKNLIGDINNREFEEPWPKGRTNHYWFDLNRDWLLLQQPETKGRIKIFHEWKPNVVTDHHEMGSNSTFFFQPGVPSRKHPLTPEKNVRLTEMLAEYHAQALDKHTKLYYSKEDFDDFYFGKGSTYPDLNGSIGILFEQASSRGHLRETENGILDFPSTIKNQFIVSLSSLKGSYESREELLKYQGEFYQNALTTAKQHANEAYIFGDNKDTYRVNELARILISHDINVYKPYKDIGIGSKNFGENCSYVVPLNQPQHLLIQAMFEKRKEFDDSLFYDISAWSLELAFNMEIELLNDKSVPELIDKSERILSINRDEEITVPESKYGYIVPWVEYHSPAILNRLLNHGLLIKVASEPFYPEKSKEFKAGSLLIPINNQPVSGNDIQALLQELCNQYQIKIYPAVSGATHKGIDLGSPGFQTVERKKIALVVGEGINYSEAGELWHLLDVKMDIPVTLMQVEKIDEIKLFEYSTIIFPDGNFNAIKNDDRIRNWINEGGILIAQNDAVKWLKNKNIYLGTFRTENKNTNTPISYGQREKYKGSQNMSGAIFNTKIDLTHPLCYGYENENLPVFKNSKIWMEPSELSFNNPVTFTHDPLLAGYVSDTNLELLKASSGVTVVSVGKGKIIAFSFNPNFRSFWYGTEKLFLNSIFFGDLMSTQL